MSVISKRKRILYKKAQFLNDIDSNLECLLSEALPNGQAVLSRREAPNSDSSYFRVINYHGKHQGQNGGFVKACEIVAYEPGANKPSMNIDQDASLLPMRAFRISEDGSEEFLDGAAYIAVFEDHVIIAQSKSVRTLEVEQHINWLLRSHTSLLPEQNRISLVDLPPPKLSHNLKDIKGLEISQNVQFAVPNNDKEEINQENIPFMPVGAAWEAVKSFVGDFLDLPTMAKADEIVRKGNLEVSMQLRWKTRSPGAESAFLSNIGNQARHIDDELDYKVLTASGPISKSEFKLESHVSCDWRDDRPAFEQIFPAMADWLDSLIDSGRV